MTFLKKLEPTDKQKKKGNRQNHLKCYYPFNMLEYILAALFHASCRCTFFKHRYLFFSVLIKACADVCALISDHHLPSPLCGKFQEGGAVLLVSLPPAVSAHSRPVRNERMSEFPKGIAQYITLSRNLFFFSFNLSATSLHISS